LIALSDSAPLLRVDGVPHALGALAVLAPSRRAAFPGTLRWTIELTEHHARLIARIAGMGAGSPSAALVTQMLDALRPVLLRAREARPRFVICSIDRVQCDAGSARLAGTCAPLMTSPKDLIASAM
ncbi:MAG TPA: hypothetical protein VJW73_10495, partial [Gemmatimonadaceae bacterium]|nr:hypothetical protein [Gemmatimonadaceae bacterium]